MHKQDFGSSSKVPPKSRLPKFTNCQKMLSQNCFLNTFGTGNISVYIIPAAHRSEHAWMYS